MLLSALLLRSIMIPASAVQIADQSPGLVLKASHRSTIFLFAPDFDSKSEQSR